MKLETTPAKRLALRDQLEAANAEGFFSDALMEVWEALFRDIDTLLAERAPPLPAEEGEIVAWNEFVEMTTNPVLGGVMRMKKGDVIQWWKRTHPEDTYTDQEALDEFMIVNWAWFEHQAAPLPAEVERVRQKLDDLVEHAPDDDALVFHRGLIAVAAALLSRWPGVWRPIETAPKDGTEILIGRKGERTRLVVTYEKDNDPGFPWALMADSSVNFEASWPTHWSPLPEPPHE